MRVDRPLVDERAHQRPALQRIADAAPARRPRPRRSLSASTTLVHDQPARATCSAGRRCRRPRRAIGAQGQVEVGVVGDDDRVVAAQLEDRAAEAAPPPACATRAPHRRQPVAEISGRRASCEHPLADVRAAADDQVEDAAAARGRPSPALTIVLHGDGGQRRRLGDGFQTIVSPQTAASAAFHAQTATGKLNAVMMPTGPSGCHCSNIRWPGRSRAIVSP